MLSNAAKNYADLGGCSPPQPSASVDNISSIIIAKYSSVSVRHSSAFEFIGKERLVFRWKKRLVA